MSQIKFEHWTGKAKTAAAMCAAGGDFACVVDSLGAIRRVEQLCTMAEVEPLRHQWKEAEEQERESWV